MSLQPNFYDDPWGPVTFGRYVRPWNTQDANDLGSQIEVDNEKFQIKLDVQQFKPEDITVKATDDSITVEGKHEEKQDGTSYVSRHLVRKYPIPPGHDVNKMTSSWSPEGVLTIKAPKTQQAGSSS